MDVRGLLLLILCLHTYGHVTSNHCTSDQLARCLSARNEFLTEEGYNVSTIGLYMLEDNHLRQFCVIYQTQVSGCLESMSRHCQKVSQAWIKGMKDGYTFLCREQLEEFLSFKNCLQDSTTIEHLTTCAEQFDRKKVFTNELPDSMDKDHCATYEEFIDCEADEVGIACGKEAGDWTRAYDTNVYSPYMEVLGCMQQSEEEEEETKGDGLALWIIIVIVVGAMIFVGGLIGVMCCVCRQLSDQRKGRPMQERQQLERSLSAAPTIHVEPGGKLTIQGNNWNHLEDPSNGKQTEGHRNKKHRHHREDPRRSDKARYHGDHPPLPPSSSQGSPGIVESDYLTPSPSVLQDNSVRYHMDPTRQYQPSQPPSYRSGGPASELEYITGSPPPSYTSQPESNYTRLTRSTSGGSTTGVVTVGAASQDYVNNAYEDLPDITTLSESMRK